MNKISFMTANFVAREVGYHMPEGWGQGDKAANDWFSPEESFGERFDAMLAEVAELGFDAIDLWTAHLNFAWATQRQIDTARALLSKRGMGVVSYAGCFGKDLEEFRSCCRLCKALGVPILGGCAPLLLTNRPAMVSELRSSGLAFAYENHPERTPEEVLAALGDGDEDVIGAAVDTGWFGMYGYDAAKALRKIGGRAKHLHLKDVKPPRAEKTGFPMIDMGHETCRLGTGVVPVEACVRLLPEIGYKGTVSIEHEPEAFDPRRDCMESRLLVEKLLRQTGRKTQKP